MSIINTKLAQFLFILGLLFSSVAIVSIVNTKEVQAGHFNWAPGVSCPGSSAAPLQTGYIAGFEISGGRYYSGINISVPSGTPSASATVFGEATICQHAPYNQVDNARIATFGETPGLSVGDIWCGTMFKWPGYICHGSTTATINTAFLGTGWHTFCFNWEGAGNYPHLGGAYITTPPPPTPTCINVEVQAPPPTFWNYDISNIDPSPSGTYKAGSAITFTSRVRNNGSGGGGWYTHEIIPLPADAPYLSPGTTATFGSQTPLGPGSARDRARTHTIRGSARHGENLCFYSRVSPAGGQSTPIFTVTDFSDQTGNKCYTVYNQRFGLNSPTVTPRQPTASPGEFVDFDFQVCNNNTALAQLGFSGATHFFTPPSGARPVMTTSPGNLLGAINNDAMPQTARNGCYTVTKTYQVPPGAQAGDLVCPAVTVAPTYGWSDGTGSAGSASANLNNCPPDTTVVVFSPYMKALGSDIVAGGFFSETPPAGTVFSPSNHRICSNYAPGSPQFDAANGAVIKGHIKALGFIPVGASNQFATYSMGNTGGFGSGSGPSGPVNVNLTFSNGDNSGPVTAATVDQYGYYHTEPRCITNLYDNLSKDAADGVGSLAGTTGSVAPGQYFRNGHLTINPMTITGPTTIIVNGNVTINGNIQYSSTGGWASQSAIPLLTLVAKGNITISNGVTIVDGLFVAQPDFSNAAEDGTIDTCNRPPSGQIASTTCPNKLTVNGTFVAQRVNFWRSSGSVSQITDFAQDQTTFAAEIFRFSPEMYLADPNYIWDNPPPITTTIPGIQQIKELPPVR